WLKAFCADPTFMASMALTEPDAGGDNALPFDAPGAGVRTAAVRDGDHYVLNGMKCFIAQSGAAKLYFVFTRTDPTKGILEGCSCFLIPLGHPGMSFGRIHDKMGSRLIRNQEIFFENCRVPKEWMLGREGAGLIAIRGSLATDGVLGGARAVGVARRALEDIVEFCKMRVQGGKPVIQHQAIASELADMYATLQAMRSLVWNVAWSVDHLPPEPKRVPAVMTFCTKHAFDIAHRAAELAGGMGVMREAPFEKLLRDAFSLKHLDGGNYIKRLKIGAGL
ncbi:MAG: acyl-CoA dehydrogenase, partial [bacterium]